MDSMDRLLLSRIQGRPTGDKKDSLPCVYTPMNQSPRKTSICVSAFLRSVPSKGSVIFREKTEESCDLKELVSSKLVRQLRVKTEEDSSPSIAFRTCERFYTTATQGASFFRRASVTRATPRRGTGPPRVISMPRELGQLTVEGQASLNRNESARFIVSCTHANLPMSFVLSCRLKVFELAAKFCPGGLQIDFGSSIRGELNPRRSGGFDAVEFILSSAIEDEYKLTITLSAPPVPPVPKPRRKPPRREDIAKILAARFGGENRVAGLKRRLAEGFALARNKREASRKKVETIASRENHANEVRDRGREAKYLRALTANIRLMRPEIQQFNVHSSASTLP